jgi:hypothetical protein
VGEEVRGWVFYWTAGRKSIIFRSWAGRPIQREHTALGVQIGYSIILYDKMESCINTDELGYFKFHYHVDMPMRKIIMGNSVL